jgi:hypothetical protein
MIRIVSVCNGCSCAGAKETCTRDTRQSCPMILLKTRTKAGYDLALLAAFAPLHRDQSKRVAVAAGKATGAEHFATAAATEVRFEHVPDPSTPRRFRPFRFFPKLEAKTRLYLTARQRRIRNRLRIGILAREHASFTTVENVI